MAPPAFWKKMSQSERAEFDAEIRRRAYGDCMGMVDWLKDKGINVCKSKSSIANYSKALFIKDQSLSATDLPPETARAIVEAVALALKTIAAIGRVLDTLRDESAPD